jgi:hypothetical protein
MSSSSLTSDSILVSGGNNGSIYWSSSHRYADSANTFACRAYISIAKWAGTGSSMNSNNCLFIGGANAGGYSNTTERYNDGEHYFKGFAIK